MLSLDHFHFSSDMPYPPVKAEEKNPAYARVILDNVGGANSEMSAISLYVYNNLMTESNKEIADVFRRISIVEMRHLDIFGELALKLGTDPRLWSYNKGRMYYWCPGCNQYPTQIHALLTNALEGEIQAIRKYHAQSEWIEDGHIRSILNRIIADEELHVKIFRSLLSELSMPEPEPQSEPAESPEPTTQVPT